MIGLAVALLCLAALRWRRGIALVASAVVVGLAALVLQWWADAGALLRVIQTIGSLDNRLIIWSRAWQMVQDYPLTGIGMGTFKYRLDTTYPLFQSTFNIPHAHNLFLQIALDLGVVGLLAWLSIVALLIRAAWRVYRSGRARGEAWTAGLGAGLIASHGAMLTHGVFDAVVWGMVRTAVMVWVVWAFATIAQRLLVGRAKGDADAAHLNDVLE
jgi:putative inorganic carbon (hco3(-)) transporter